MNLPTIPSDASMTPAQAALVNNLTTHMNQNIFRFKSATRRRAWIHDNILPPFIDTFNIKVTRSLRRRATQWFLARASSRIRSRRALGAYGFGWKDGIPTMHHNGSWYVLSLNRDAVLYIRVEMAANNPALAVPTRVCLDIGILGIVVPTGCSIQ
ncbi:hypothetical protein B0H11DRAFT_1921749 [Mycena galericulata]|nr:hypothetical protein B0H11DRAFT_1921749 [Mycena galericulata]